MPILFRLKQFRNPVFVETGLYRGHGVQQALKAGFKQIYSIETHRHYVRRARRRFRQFVKAGRVQLIAGQSDIELPRLLETITERCTFWLDAHGGGHSPLIAELEAILAHPRDDHTILIDDVRKFASWGVDAAQVEALLLQINPDYDLSFCRGWQGRPDVRAAVLKETE